jgi:hypothetical protein
MGEGRSRHRRLTYARIMSTLAVFLALTSGTALAAYVISTNAQIGPDTVSGHRTIPGLHANVIGGSINGKDLAAGAVTSSKLAKIEPYRVVGTAGQPAFQHQWTNTAPSLASAAFFKDPTGVVHLRGSVENGHSAAVIFTLPPGYRPARQLNLPVAVSASGVGWLEISTSGTVAPIWSGSGLRSVGMDGLSFRAGS